MCGRSSMKEFIHEIPKASVNPPVRKEYDVVVVGGGMSGLCAAIASAREGARTALVHDRSVYGGNASSETRMHISGASCHWGKKNAAETGILMELQLENKYLNDDYVYSIWDGVLWNAVKTTDNLDSYMNTTMDMVHSDGKRIQSISCYQMSTEIRYEFSAKVYIDATGNGTLGYFAGAEYSIGREDKGAFGEKDAPDRPDGDTMGNTIYFVAEDTGHPVKFVRPPWAYSYPDEHMFKYRYHGNTVVYHDADDVVVLKPGEDYTDHSDQLVEKYDVKSGYWWIEIGGDWDDIIRQSEDIRWELYRIVYGVWDHIKNHGDHGAANYKLTWVGAVAGWRESRRLTGKEMLTEQDILANRRFPDAVAYGGWPMDEHTAAGFMAVGQIPSKVRSFPGLYTIPYGSYCSSNIENLMMAGRDIGCSKLAMGSTRVMGTCAVGGQAVGTAAAMAAKRHLDPWEFGRENMDGLQQELLKNDCYIPGVTNHDDKDLARNAVVSAGSEKKGFEAALVLNGKTRPDEGGSNEWQSEELKDAGDWINLKLAKPEQIHQVRLTFDPNLSEEICISVSKAFIEKEKRGVPGWLVRDYDVVLSLYGREIGRKQVEGNHQRLNIVEFPSVKADEIRIEVHTTNGSHTARIFEIRVY
jgi:hypothetical protein